MALTPMLINLFPGAVAKLAAVTDVAVLAGGLLVAVLGFVWLRRAQQTAEVRLEAASHGLGESSAAFLARVLGLEGAEMARALLRSPDLLRQRLATELGSRRRKESAVRFARRCAELMTELRAREPAFPGAPLLFESMTLHDSVEPDAPGITGVVVQVDERNLAIVTSDTCRWPVRRDLHALTPGPQAEPFLVTLLLRPMPGCREWVLGHELLDDGSQPNGIRRFVCRIAAWALPNTCGTYALRGQLQTGRRIDPETMRQLAAWPRRRHVTIEDLSGDGARLLVDHELERGDRFYLVISEPNGPVSAMPLAEVVSVRPADSGRQIVGTRFCAVRQGERGVLAEYAKEAEMAATG